MPVQAIGFKVNIKIRFKKVDISILKERLLKID